MDKNAIERANVSLTRAVEFFRKIEFAQTFDEFEAAWSNFLLAANRIFTQLELGSKVNNKSIGWFAGRKGQRRSDALINYMWHARNADEHGLEQITSREPARMLFSGTGNYKITGRGGAPLRMGSDQPIDMEITHSGGENPKIEFTQPYAKLATVKMRDGTAVPVPHDHLGVSLPDESPVTVAKLFLTYVQAMLSEARTL
jgi:hypothetical protein